MNRINIACFDQSKTPHVYDIWQWDYGQILRIQGLNLPSAVQIDFSLTKTGGESTPRIGITRDGVTDVAIPDSMLEKDTTQDYYAYAFIYLTDDVSGQTEYKITMHVKARPKPEGRTSDDKTTMAEILKTVNEIADDKVAIPTTAKVGQVLAVKETDESGKPTEFEAADMKGGSASIDDSVTSSDKTWSSRKIAEELSDCIKYVKITVNLIGSEGNIPLGNTVYAYEIVDDIATLSYSCVSTDGSAIIRIARGSKYKISASADAEGFYAPTEVTGVAINDESVTIRYTELAYPKTIKDLQTLAKMNLAADVVSIGDEFTDTYTYNGTEYEMPWIVTDIKEVEFEDGSTGQGVYLEAKYATIESIQFDAPHQEVATEETAVEGLYYIGRTDNTYTLLDLNAGESIPYSDYTYIYHDTIRDTSLNIYRYGHNRVSTSAYRQWLNSDADKGNWWTAPKVGYCPPTQLNSQKGFMAGLSQEFIDCVAKTKRTYYTNSVTDGSVIDVLYDKFFAATVTEIYGSANDNEGTYWPYYKEVTGLTSPSNSQNTGRIKYALNAKTSPQGCWSFSSYRGNSCNVWYRYTTGQLYSNYAYGSFRAVPACVIG